MKSFLALLILTASAQVATPQRTPAQPPGAQTATTSPSASTQTRTSKADENCPSTTKPKPAIDDSMCSIEPAAPKSQTR